MRITLSALGVSVGAKLGQVLGNRIEEACRVLVETDRIEPGRFCGWTEAGCLLAAALAPASISAANLDAVAAMQLRLVCITEAHHSVSLAPSDIADHALLRGWIAPTLGETFGRALKAGADLSHAGGAGPEAWGATVLDDVNQRVGAEVALRFGANVFVCAHFGADVSDSSSITQRTLVHPAIFAIGAGAADFSEPAVEGSANAGVQMLIARAEAERAGGFIQ